MEAIQILAAEAGLPVPQSDPRAQEKADARTVLVDVMEQAVQHFRLNLQTAAAGAARDYLAGRGLDADALARWDIGFAPDQGGVLGHLTGKGVDRQLVIDAGLAAESDRGGSPYDRFRGRIIFPIRDARGRAIALGGRAMAADARAKYLNSPETALFDKSRTLYNHGAAREAAGKGAPLVVAEGYMDVIALSEAGFPATVAPLGTAVTEHHLRMLWRIAPEPIIALDGDTAGLRAAMRTIDIALPLLEAGQSLRFAMMPEGMDPDDVLKAKGRGAMQKLLDAAIPMVELLWKRETDGKVFDSPERKAALDKALREKIKLIADPSIRAHYGQAIKDMRWALFSNRPAAPKKSGARAWTKGQTDWQRNVAPVATAKSSALGGGAASEEGLVASVLLATIITTPSVLPQFEIALERMHVTEALHDAIRHAILRHADASDLRAAVNRDIGPDALEKLFAQPHVAITPTVAKHAGDIEVARNCLTEGFAKLAARKGHLMELEESQEAMTGNVDEGLTWRLSQAAAALNQTGKGDNNDKTEYDYGENGAPMKKDERSALDDLMEQIDFAKRRPDAK